MRQSVFFEEFVFFEKLKISSQSIEGQSTHGHRGQTSG
jgi:hypothetical protein